MKHSPSFFFSLYILAVDTRSLISFFPSRLLITFSYFIKMKPDDSCIIGLEETVIETDEDVTRHSLQSTPSTESTCDNESTDNEEKEPYTAFSIPQQILFLTITAFTAMMSPLTANIYLPSLNQIQRVNF